ncbi:MAG: hypothetical protein K9J30_06800 [Bacteroidales bacterium]|nr:hypothetical protein [Bacteroidales bacterium]
MRKGLLFIAIAGLLIALPGSLQAQCKQFAKKVCKVGLKPYQHDGNYHAALLIEGEEAELYKTFYSNTDYRIGVCGAGNLNDVEFRIMDNNNKVLYNNKYENYEWKWDFKLESSQQLKIVVKVPSPENNMEEPKEGCVAIMFGFKDE